MFTKEGERAIGFVHDIENISTTYGLKRTDAIELFKMITLSNICQEIKDVADVIDVGSQRIRDSLDVSASDSIKPGLEGIEAGIKEIGITYFEQERRLRRQSEPD